MEEGWREERERERERERRDQPTEDETRMSRCGGGLSVPWWLSRQHQAGLASSERACVFCFVRFPKNVSDVEAQRRVQRLEVIKGKGGGKQTCKMLEEG